MPHDIVLCGFSIDSLYCTTLDLAGQIPQPRPELPLFSPRQWKKEHGTLARLEGIVCWYLVGVRT